VRALRHRLARRDELVDQDGPQDALVFTGESVFRLHFVDQ